MLHVARGGRCAPGLAHQLPMASSASSHKAWWVIQHRLPILGPLAQPTCSPARWGDRFAAQGGGWGRSGLAAAALPTVPVGAVQLRVLGLPASWSSLVLLVWALG